jgi:hypothetical protein
VSSVSGFISGSGALGAVLQGPLIAFSIMLFGETGVAVVLILLVIVSIISLGRTLSLDQK